MVVVVVGVVEHQVHVRGAVDIVGIVVGYVREAIIKK